MDYFPCFGHTTALCPNSAGQSDGSNFQVVFRAGFSMATLSVELLQIRELRIFCIQGEKYVPGGVLLNRLESLTTL